MDIEYNGDDDALLDWEQYSRDPSCRCCGIEFGITPPAWWYQMSRRRRRWAVATGGCLLTFTFLVVALTAAAAAKRHFNFGSRSLDHACNWDEWRLPEGVAPTRYNLTFQVEMQDPWQVHGLADVGIIITHPTRCIVVHVADLAVTDARVGDGEGIPARRRYNEALEQLTLEWDDPIPVGYIPLHMKFQYQLSTGMSGFYRSTYPLKNGGTGVLAATQFEANAARRAFPCFDEPSLKAEFAVEVITQKGLMVLSNMPARAAHHHEHQDESEFTWHFETSPPMSTYLVAIVIGDLRSVTRTVPPPTVPVPSHLLSPSSSFPAPATEPIPRNVTLWGIPDQVANLEYAADAAAAILPAFETAFGTAYALPKLDLIAIPDFAAGAMENWGLITYRQTALLVSPTSSEADKRYVVKVVAHEMAHQWFGNLVTMNWWNDLWLNEGFASYLEFLGADVAHPGQSFYEYYYPNDVPYALHYDSKRAAHAMSLPVASVNSTDRIESLFDPVEYERGGAVLRMLRAYINRGNASVPVAESWEAAAGAAGPAADPFLAGLHQYLSQYQFNSTTASQLWDALSPAVGVDLGALMEAWTFQQGYPVLSVSVDAKGGVWVTQAPFSLANGAGPCDSTVAWWVPVSFVSSEAPMTPKWAELNACQSLRPLIPALPKGGWVKVNARQYGYYRVNYSPELWFAATTAAAQRDAVTSFPVMRGVDYAGLIEDSYALAEAGMLEASVFLETLKALPERPASDYAPWSVALGVLYSVDSLVECQSQWRTYVLGDVLQPFMNNVSLAAGGAPIMSSFIYTGEGTASTTGSTTAGGMSNGTTNAVPVGQRLLRPAILRAAGYFGSTVLGEEATTLLSTSVSSLSTDLRSAVYETAARSSPDPQAAFDKIKSLYREAIDVHERERTLRALGHSPLAVPSALEFAMSGEVKAQDVPTLVVTTALGGDQAALRGTWDWFKEHWEELYEKLGGDGDAARRLGQMLERIGSGFADTAVESEVDEVYAAHAGHQSESGYAERAKESIRAHAQWVKRHSEAVCAWVEVAMSDGP